MSRNDRKLFWTIATGVAWSLALETLAAAATLSGDALALKSDGSASGSAYVLDRNGYVGTYITLPSPGTVSIKVSAIGSGGANMGIVVGDFRKDFIPTSGLYSASLNLPAGTHFIRTELNNDPGTPNRNLRINSLEVNGAEFANTHNSANALAASDTYIQNFRRGPVKITGLQPGAAVSVSLQRLDFGLLAPASSSDIAEHPYDTRFRQNFNGLVCRCYWDSTEPSQGNLQLGQMRTLLNYAKTHHLGTRLHTAYWEDGEPAWARDLRISGNATAARNAVRNRIDYYMPFGYDEVDLYNESWNALEERKNPYWNLFGGAPGMAEMYQYAKSKAPDAKIFVNDYGVLQGPSDDFGRHIDSVGLENIDGIGLQFYTNNFESTSAQTAFLSLQNMSVRHKPLLLSEFGTFESVDQPELVLNNMLRLMFGNPQSTGFVIWDWLNVKGSESFAPWSALYTVDPADWNTISITDTGRMWQDMLGIADWDGNPNNGWNTQLSTTVGADGSINFNGYYGDYVVTVDGQPHNLTLVKGTTTYDLSPALSGDFNRDGRVDAADYTVWRGKFGTVYSQRDYELWKEHFGEVRPLSTSTLKVPEPRFAASLLASLLWGFASVRRFTG